MRRPHGTQVLGPVGLQRARGVPVVTPPGATVTGARSTAPMPVASSVASLEPARAVGPSVSIRCTGTVAATVSIGAQGATIPIAAPIALGVAAMLGPAVPIVGATRSIPIAATARSPGVTPIAGAAMLRRTPIVILRPALAIAVIAAPGAGLGAAARSPVAAPVATTIRIAAAVATTIRFTATGITTPIAAGPATATISAIVSRGSAAPGATIARAVIAPRAATFIAVAIAGAAPVAVEVTSSAVTA